MHQSILTLARQIPACAGIGETLLDAFCTVAEEELRRRLRGGVTAESIGVRFICAAALLAAAMSVASDSGADESLKAGSVSVSRRGGGKDATALRAEAFALLQGSLEDEGFVFLGVQL